MVLLWITYLGSIALVWAALRVAYRLAKQALDVRQEERDDVGLDQ